MAFSNTYDTTNTGSAVSNREGLSDILTIFAPEETPVLSTLGKEKVSSTFFEWTVDGLAAPVTTGIGEGDDVTSYTDKFASRARIGNYVQKFRRDYMVSDLQEALIRLALLSLLKQKLKHLVKLSVTLKQRFYLAMIAKQRMEQAHPYQLRGLGDWIDSAGPSDVPAAYRTPADSIYTQAEATATPFSETSLNDLITSTFRVNGASNSLMLVADTALRRHISDYSRIIDTGVNDSRRVNMSDGETTINNRVDLYQSDHGIISIVNMNPDCSPNSTDKDVGFILNPEYLGIGELIPMGTQRNPNLGGGERGFVDCALTLICKHPGAHGKIDAIS